jgi:dynein assembly factor 1
MSMLGEKEDDGVRMSQEFFKQFLRSDPRLYYNTKELNEVLYLHYKGFRKMENMEGFTGVKCIYFESNCKRRA